MAAFNEQMQQALQGDPIAQHQVAIAFHFGEGTSQDLAEAVHWWSKSAAQGYSKAQYNIARCFLLADGVERDVPKAVHWLSKAAESGMADAQFRLAYTLLTVDGYEFTESEVIISLFRKAAAAGHAEACYWLGQCYEAGAGVDEDAEESRRWLSLAGTYGYRLQ